LFIAQPLNERNLRWREEVLAWIGCLGVEADGLSFASLHFSYRKVETVQLKENPAHLLVQRTLLKNQQAIPIFSIQKGRQPHLIDSLSNCFFFFQKIISRTQCGLLSFSY
jgi:hypothetical protein